MKTLALVVAHDENRLIGINGDLPWRLPDDLAHFKRLTLGKTVLMGRKTWESLPKKPLPDRENWVLTRDPGFEAAGARVFTSLQAALAAGAGRELMVIGGAELYALVLPMARRLHLTEVASGIPRGIAGGVYFPAYEAGAYRLLEETAHPADARHAFAYTYKMLERI